jgi:hypothetical protein
MTRRTITAMTAATTGMGIVFPPMILTPPLLT